MTPSANSPAGSDHELLVAYLDGELAPDEALQVEQRLSEDDEFRRLLKGLQDAWDLLDELPQPTLDDGFTRTTVEMVAVRMNEEVTRQTSNGLSAPAVRRVAAAIAVALCCTVGFLVVRTAQQTPDEQLLRDLPIVEQVVNYSQIEDLAFLEALAEDGLFNDSEASVIDSNGSGTSPPRFAEEDPAE